MQSCYHCNSDCIDEVVLDDKTFCCHGCKTVFEIFTEANLSDYYKLNDRPGSQIKTKSSRYDYLDIPEIQQKLVSFQEGNTTKIQLLLPQIHCSSCLWLLENLQRLDEGVMMCQVNFVSKEATIMYDSSVTSLRKIAELLDSIGYRPDIDLTPNDSKKRGNKQNKVLIYRLGVVGFCFGNIMLLSFPEYLGLDSNFAQFQATFNWLNLALSIPILIFGAGVFLKSAFKSLAKQVVNIDVPISLGIFALYGRSLFEIISGSGAGYFDSFAGLIFFLLIGRWFQQKTYASINFERDYKSYFPISVTKMNDDVPEILPLEKLESGDKLLVRNGELIPTDAVLLSGEAMIDYSFVSGESTLVSKSLGDKLFAGGRQNGGSLVLESLNAVDNSYLTKLWNNPIFHKKQIAKSFADNVSKYFTLLVLIISLIAGFVWFQIDPNRVAFIVTSVLIVACPCAIALSVPFTYGNVLRIFGEKEVYLRSTDVIEPLQGVTDIVFDKTGTLTKNNAQELIWKGVDLDQNAKNCISSLAFQSTHPLSKSIFKYFGFQNEEKLMTVVQFKEFPSEGIYGEIDGNSWYLGKGQNSANDQDFKTTQVYVSVNGKELGCFSFKNLYREGIETLFKNLNQRYDLHILSGDNDAEKSHLSTFIPTDNLRFDQSPEDKLEYVNKLQENGRIVLMLGDGLNDAGALKQANVGLAVVDEIHAFSPSSDVIMDAENIKKLKNLLNFAGYSKKVVLWSYGFSIIYNVTGLIFALTGQLTPLVAAILMPLSSISTVLLVTFLTRYRANKLI